MIAMGTTSSTGRDQGPSRAQSSGSPRRARRGNTREVGTASCREAWKPRGHGGCAAKIQKQNCSPGRWRGRGAAAHVHGPAGRGAVQTGVQRLQKRVGRSLTKQTLSFPYDPAVRSPEFYPAELRPHVHTKPAHRYLQQLLSQMPKMRSHGEAHREVMGTHAPSGW